MKKNIIFVYRYTSALLSPAQLVHTHVSFHFHIFLHNLRTAEQYTRFTDGKRGNVSLAKRINRIRGAWILFTFILMKSIAHLTLLYHLLLATDGFRVLCVILDATQKLKLQKKAFLRFRSAAVSASFCKNARGKKRVRIKMGLIWLWCAIYVEY